jgi:hypothetical protein
MGRLADSGGGTRPSHRPHDDVRAETTDGRPDPKEEMDSTWSRDRIDRGSSHRDRPVSVETPAERGSPGGRTVAGNTESTQARREDEPTEITDSEAGPVTNQRTAVVFQ